MVFRLGFFALILAISSCSLQPVTPAPDLSPMDIAAQYRLGAGDQVRITVFNQTNLSGEFTLDNAGFIAMPLLGPIASLDKTPRELEQTLVNALTQGGYLVNPSVVVQVSQFRPYYILGEVSQPGVYPYTARLTVRNAVAAAHGFTYRANTRRVFIQRAGEHVERLYELTPAMLVLPGDTLRIPDRWF